MLPTSLLSGVCAERRGPNLFEEGWLATVDDLRVVLQPIVRGHYRPDDGLPTHNG
jgi:hypothetical protein